MGWCLRKKANVVNGPVLFVVFRVDVLLPVCNTVHAVFLSYALLFTVIVKIFSKRSLNKLL